MAKLYFRYGVIGSGKSANARMTHRAGPGRKHGKQECPGPVKL